LLSAKRNALDSFLNFILQNEGKSWSEFYRFVNRRKGNRETVPALKDGNGGLITDPVEKANHLNNYYASVFGCERDKPNINPNHSDKTFTSKINVIRKRLKTIGSNKSVGSDGIPSSILKLGGEAMIPYLARLLDTTVNNGTLPRDWKSAVVVPIHKGGDRSSAKNYRPVSLTSVVCKSMQHVIIGYIRKMWDDSDWLYEGQHGFRTGYSCES